MKVMIQISCKKRKQHTHWDVNKYSVIGPELEIAGWGQRQWLEVVILVQGTKCLGRHVSRGHFIFAGSELGHRNSSPTDTVLIFIPSQNRFKKGD